MLFFVTKKRLQKILESAYHQGIVNGYNLGYRMGLVEKQNRCVIWGNQIEKDIREILEKNGFGKS